VQKQYDILFAFLKTVAACQKPDQKMLESLVTPLADSIEAISRAKEAYRRDRDWFSHLTLLSEGAPVIGWVVNVSFALVFDLCHYIEFVVARSYTVCHRYQGLCSLLRK